MKAIEIYCESNTKLSNDEVSLDKGPLNALKTGILK